MSLKCGKHPFQFQVFIYLLVPGEPDKAGFVFVFFLSAEKNIQSQVCSKIRREDCGT